MTAKIDKTNAPLVSPEAAKEHASCLSPDPACVDAGRDPVRCVRRSLAWNTHRSSPLPRATVYQASPLIGDTTARQITTAGTW